MNNESLENSTEQDVVNETLKDVLCNDGWGKSRWDRLVKSLQAEFGIETDLLALAQGAPCLAEMFQIGALARKGIIGSETREKLSEIIHKLVRIAVHAEEGDERASNQLKVIHKLALPNNYALPASVIKNLADSYHISAHLARAWSIRSLMIELSFVVEPTHDDRSVLDGPVRLTTTNVHLLNPEIYEKAKRHIKKNTTLQSLAIAIYLEELGREEIYLEPRQLKHDLQKLKEWEVLNLKDQSRRLPLWDGDRFPPASLPSIPVYSDGWKLRWRRGDKT